MNPNFYNISSFYEGASTQLRLERKGLQSNSETTIAQAEYLHLLRRSQHLYRNNPIARAIFTVFQTNLRSVDVIWVDKDGVTNNRMQDLWKSFADNPSYDAYGNLHNIQENWQNSFMMTGDSFTRLIIEKRTDSKIPLYLQLIPSINIDPTYTEQELKIRNSIKFSNGRPSTYFFSKNVESLEVGTRVPIKAERMLHIYKRLDASAYRGYPLLSPIIIDLYSLADLVDAITLKQLSASLLSWVIQKPKKSMAPVAPSTTGVEQKVTDNGDKINVSRVTGNQALYLESEEEIQLLEGEGIGNNISDFIKSQLHAIAGAVGLPYEFLTTDVDEVSFSGLKHLANMMNTTCNYWHTNYFISLGLMPLCNFFKILAYQNDRKLKANLRPSFRMPRPYIVDEFMRAKADELEVVNGFSTRERKQADRDVTPEEVKMSESKNKPLKSQEKP